MSLEMRRSSSWWYGAFTVNGKRRILNLGVRIEGRRPRTLWEQGDAAFERSRGRAQAAHDEKKASVESARLSDRDLRRLIRLKQGETDSLPPLDKVPSLWEALPRSREPSNRYLDQGRSLLQGFVTFVRSRRPDCRDFADVTPELAAAYMDWREEGGIAPKTYNDTAKLLRGAFRRLHPDLGDTANPFRHLVAKESDTVHRRPFTVEELGRILDACREDDFIRPIIVTGMSTAMRRGDCCLLKWDDVDLEAGFIRVKTSKTGETVEIPVFPMFRDELIRAQGRRATSGDADGEECCFPEQAAMYLHNPDGITRRVKDVLADALQNPKPPAAEGRLDEVTDGAARLERYLDSLPDSPRTGRMRRVLRRYLEGATVHDVARAAGVSVGSVSGYLAQVEAATGIQVVRRRSARAQEGVSAEPTGRQKAKESRRRRASVRDFHSFRVTWVTLALAAGVPIQLVQQVTGHRTTEVVLRHYFKPGREDFREAIGKALPSLISGPSRKGSSQGPDAGEGDTVAAAIRELEHMADGDWVEGRERVLALLREMRGA